VTVPIQVDISGRAMPTTPGPAPTTESTAALEYVRME
jgi:hypothetical protein